MASTPPWNTTSEPDPLRFTTTSMAAAAFTPPKPRRRVPWGVDELRPSTSPAKPPTFRRSSCTTIPAPAAQREMPIESLSSKQAGRDTGSGRRRGGLSQAWEKAAANPQTSTLNSKARTPTRRNKSSSANTISTALVVASPAARQRPPASRSIRPALPAASVSPFATNLQVTKTTRNQQQEVARRTGLSAHSIHTSSAPEGQARPRRYFSNYLDAAQGHTYKVSEVDHHVLTNRNLESSPPAPVPLVFRQFQHDSSRKRITSFRELQRLKRVHGYGLC